ncbi:hypothetical protein M8C21_009939, partial [Ambrosia artemisiifolia]
KMINLCVLDEWLEIKNKLIKVHLICRLFFMLNKSQNDEELVTSAYSGDCLELKSKVPAFSKKLVSYS